MREAFTERQQYLIAKNLIKAATIDIESLNKTAYQYISGCCGFIAHYDREGFISSYGTPQNLRHDIVHNAKANQYNNFRPNDVNYDYYMSKRNVYEMVVEGIKNVSYA
jgi:hypothetical protein